MKHSRMHIFQLIFILMLFITPAVFAAESYMLMAFQYNYDIYYMFSVSELGVITYRSAHSNEADLKGFTFPHNMKFSKNGRFIAFSDFNGDYGKVYSINQNFQLRFIHGIAGACDGGGFTEDESYFFTTTNYMTDPPKPKVNIYKTSATGLQLVRSQDVPTTGALSFNIHCNLQDEVFAPADNGWLNTASFIVYQFDRQNESLNFKQYLPLNKSIYNNISSDYQRRMVFYAEGKAGTIVRDSDGIYREKSSGWSPDGGYGGVGADITPDGKYAVAAFSANGDAYAAGNGGLVLFAVREDGTLEHLSIAKRKALWKMAMTPDGKYFVTGYVKDNEINYGDHEYLGVFRLDRESKTLIEVSTLAITNGRMYPMAFLPQCGPKAASDGRWVLYE